MNVKRYDVYTCSFGGVDEVEVKDGLYVRYEDIESSLEWVLHGFKSILEGKPVRDADEIICHIESILGKNK